MQAPEASTLRLSRYHCFVGELLRAGESPRLTSHEMATQLGVSEETVRRDLSFIDLQGRPGSGYEAQPLHDALEEYLGLTAIHPFAAIAELEMLLALTVTFPASEFEMRPAAYFSPRDEDAGAVVGGILVRHTSELPGLRGRIGADVALVACAPDAVPESLDLLHEAGIDAVLMVTPTLRPHHPDGMSVTYFRIPCALKALVSQATATVEHHCCAQPTDASSASAGVGN